MRYNTGVINSINSRGATANRPRPDTRKVRFLMLAYSTRIPHFPENLQGYAPWVATKGLLAPYGECQCGCGLPAPIAKRNEFRRGHKKGQPMPYIQNHYGKFPVMERFWAKVNRRGPDECWEWTGTRKDGEYGMIKVDGVEKVATRVGYEHLIGPIPDGMFVCHRCDNPPCCNPNHWFLGTFKDNMDDMFAKGRQSKGITRTHAKLTDSAVIEARDLYASGIYTFASLARRYGVNAVTIFKAVKGITWKHLREGKVLP